jgi:hypothetical protein
VQGWIRVDRKIVEHWLWDDRPFSRGQAFIDLILMANHKENTFLHGTELLTVERGSFITSELKLMERWGWSKSKVRYFLNALELDSMLVKKTDRKKTTITIVNYSVYQDLQTTEEPIKDRRKTTKRPQKDTNNNDNNDNNNNNNKDIYAENEELNKTIMDFIEFRKKIKAPMTDKAIKLMIGELNKLSSNTEEQIAIIHQSIMKSWKGVFPLKDKGVSNGEPGKQAGNGKPSTEVNKRTQRTETITERAIREGIGTGEEGDMPFM